MLSQLFCVSDVKAEQAVDKLFAKLIRTILKKDKTDLPGAIRNLTMKW